MSQLSALIAKLEAHLSSVSAMLAELKSSLGMASEVLDVVAPASPEALAVSAVDGVVNAVDNAVAAPAA